LSGLYHGEVGAETLLQGKFLDALVEEVRWHHRPEPVFLTPLASLLYLPASACGPACRQTGVDPEALADLNREQPVHLEFLRFAALDALSLRFSHRLNRAFFGTLVVNTSDRALLTPRSLYKSVDR
jgi:hypothetical protein